MSLYHGQEKICGQDQLVGNCVQCGRKWGFRKKAIKILVAIYYGRVHLLE